jgi:hypothetical protein
LELIGQVALLVEEVRCLRGIGSEVEEFAFDLTTLLLMKD